MPTPSYLWMKDDQDGDIKGSVQIVGREGSIEIMEFSHDIHLTMDAYTGAPTGRRSHGPIVFLKSYDSASPYMYKACCTGQTLKEVTIRWYMIDETGTEKEYFNHKLENARITAVKAQMPNTKDPTKERYVHNEEVSMVYEKITWKYCDGNIEFEDSWTNKT